MNCQCARCSTAASPGPAAQHPAACLHTLICAPSATLTTVPHPLLHLPADATGTRHTIASTQFQSLAARKAFPCFDEPRYKAPFNLTLTSPLSHTALSNMPLLAAAPTAAGLLQHSFQTSPPMPTYLLAWVLGELDSVSRSCQGQYGPVPVAVWATPDKKSLLATALSAACTSLVTFERVLRSAYPLPKLDLVGIPNFGAGAMENWGLITYR